MKLFGQSEGLPREQLLPDAAAECAHLVLRPRWESDGYLCDACHREFTTMEAEEASSEASLRCTGASALDTSAGEARIGGADAAPTHGARNSQEARRRQH